jgi:hypothetical protein
MLSLGLSYIAFIMLKNIPSIPILFQVFLMEGCWIFQGFFFIYWGDHMVFVLAFIYILYYIYRFTYVDPSLHPWKETDLVMVYDLFDELLNSACQNFVENLFDYIHSRYWAIILFSCCIFIGFRINVMLAS